MAHLPLAAALPAEALGRLARSLAWPFQALWMAWWWSLRRHVCDAYFLPRESAGPAPFAWLADEREPAPRLTSDAYGRWSWRA